jgi:hypothetical protein
MAHCRCVCVSAGCAPPANAPCLSLASYSPMSFLNLFESVKLFDKSNNLGSYAPRSVKLFEKSHISKCVKTFRYKRTAGTAPGW